MSKQNIYLFLLLLLSAVPIFTVSCTQEKSIFDEKILQVPESIVFVETGKSTSIEVEGNGGYKLKVDNPDLLRASISGGMLHLDGMKDGTTTVSITDKEGLYISLEVVVANIGTAESDSLALIDLFKNTNPDQWVQRWQINFPIKYWNGVKLNEDGRVVELDLKANGLKGVLPESISKLFFLKKLDLSFNEFSNELPDISNLINLTKFRMVFMKKMVINPETIERLTRLKKIDTLGLIDVTLTGPIKPIFDKFTNLKSLELGFKNQNHFPLEITNIEGLEVLEIYEANIGDMPPEISKLTNLKRLVLADCNMTGEIPVEISRLTNLEVLDLSDNKLVGSVPAEINDLKKLKTLLLFNNQLSALPKDLRGLDSITFIAVSNNKLQSELPEFGKAEKLRAINLHNNQITGSLPNSWSSLPSLKNIELEYNRISGQIPPSYGVMKSLEILRLNNNNISGTVPVSFASFTPKFEGDARHIDLRSNRMSGVLDPKIRSHVMYINDKWIFSPQQNGYKFDNIKKIVNGVEIDY